MYPAIIHFQKDFTANANINLPLARENNLGQLFNPPFQIIPQKWALQVTGITAAGAVTAPTAWTANLVASIDGLAFNAASLIVAHVSGVNANGDVVWNLTSAKTFYMCRFAQIQLTDLNLGATATALRICVIGDK